MRYITLLVVAFLCMSCSSRLAVIDTDVPLPVALYEQRALDTLGLTQKVSEAIQLETCSMIGLYSDSVQPFVDYIQFLERAFPEVNSVADRTIINRYSVVYKFAGANQNLAPGAFIAHIDVVPAPDPERWDYPPFGGDVVDGYIYGRGSQDMKSSMITLLEAMETLLREGYRPQRDIYFCFGHDEETATTMQGAYQIVEWFKSQNIRLEYLIDEGGTLVDGDMLSVENDFAFIGTCEKGYADMVLTVQNEGGHGSLPVKPTAVAQLSKAILKIERNPMKSVITPSLKQSLEMMAPYLPARYRLIANNPNTFLSLITPFLKENSITNALTATTFTPTVLQASEQNNVIPHEVSAVINTRIIHGSTREDVRQYMQKLVGNTIVVSYKNGTEPTTVSDTDSEYYKRFTQAISTIYPNTVAIPYMYMANSDSRFYRDICDNIYLFLPFYLEPDDQERIHGVNERCSIEGLQKATQFYIRCLELLGE